MTQQQRQQQPATLNRQLTPIQQLLADKQRVKTQCTQQEQMLNQDILFIQENAGSLLLSGLSSLLFPKNKKADTTSKDTETAVSIHKNTPANVSFSDYLSLIPGLIPVVWDVTKPFITAWGIKKVQHWAINLLFRKKEKKVNN